MRLAACVLLPFVYLCVLWLIKCNCLNPQRTQGTQRKRRLTADGVEIAIFTAIPNCET
jgi:hypothetical protein